MSWRIEPGAQRPARQRGTATVEAMAALPTLVLLFIAIFHLRDLNTGKHEASMKARSCAWLYSANGCSQEPAGCEGQLPDSDEGGSPSPALTDATSSLEGVGMGIGSAVSALLEPALKAVLGRSATALVKRKVSRPTAFGGGNASVTGRYRLACNLQETTLATLAEDAWSILPLP